MFAARYIRENHRKSFRAKNLAEPPEPNNHKRLPIVIPQKTETHQGQPPRHRCWGPSRFAVPRWSASLVPVIFQVIFQLKSYRNYANTDCDIQYDKYTQETHRLREDYLNRCCYSVKSFPPRYLSIILSCHFPVSLRNGPKVMTLLFLVLRVQPLRLRIPQGPPAPITANG